MTINGEIVSVKYGGNFSNITIGKVQSQEDAAYLPYREDIQIDVKHREARRLRVGRKVSIKITFKP